MPRVGFFCYFPTPNKEEALTHKYLVQGLPMQQYHSWKKWNFIAMCSRRIIWFNISSNKHPWCWHSIAWVTWTFVKTTWMLNNIYRLLSSICSKLAPSLSAWQGQTHVLQQNGSVVRVQVHDSSPEHIFWILTHKHWRISILHQGRIGKHLTFRIKATGHLSLQKRVLLKEEAMQMSD